jgi:hypothetical protein
MTNFTQSLSGSVGFTGSITKQTNKSLSGSLEINNLIPNGNFENAPLSNIAVTTTPNVWINGTAAGSGASSAYGWATTALTANASAGFDAAQFHSGTYSMKLSTLNASGQMTVGTSTSAAPGAGQIYQLFVLSPNTKYTLTAWIRTNNVATNGAFIDVREYSSAVSNLATTSTNKLTGTNGWTQVTSTFTTNASTAYATIFLRNNVTGNISDAWFDDITLIPSSTSNLLKKTNKVLNATQSFVGTLVRAITGVSFTGVVSFVGDTTKRLSRSFSGSNSFSGLLSSTISRTKTFVASLSFTGAFMKNTQKSLRASMNENNVVPNPGFEFAPLNNLAATNVANRWIDGSANGSNETGGLSWATTSLNGTAQAAFDNSVFHSGNSSMKLSTLSTSVDNIVVGNYRQLSERNLLFKLTPNISYTLTAWIKTNNVVASGAFIDVREFDAAFATLATTSSTKFSGTNDWMQVSFTFTAQSTTLYATIFLRNNIAGAISDVWFDDIVLAPTTSNFVRNIVHTLTASVGFVGGLSRLLSKGFAASLSFTGSQSKKVFRVLQGFVSMSVPPDQVGGGLGGDPMGGGFGSDVGAGFVKKTIRSLTGGTSFVGGITRRFSRSQTASVGFSGGLSKQIRRVFSAALAPVGLLTRIAIRGVIFVASLVPSGELRRRTSKSFTASVTPTIGFFRALWFKMTQRIRRNINSNGTHRSLGGGSNSARINGSKTQADLDGSDNNKIVPGAS